MENYSACFFAYCKGWCTLPISLPLPLTTPLPSPLGDGPGGEGTEKQFANEPISKWANAMTNFEWRMTNEENNLLIDWVAYLLFFLALFAVLGALCVPRVRRAGSQYNDE